MNGGKNYSCKCDDFNTNQNVISISEGGESCGYISWNKEKFWAGGHLYVLHLLKNYNNKYFYFLLKNYEKNIMKLRVGSSIPNIQKSDLENFKIIYSTNINEQQKIAKFLSLLDKQIDLYVSKLELTYKYKLYYLNNLFSDNGIPKMRFKGFSDEYLLKTLNDLGDSVGGTSLEEFFVKQGTHKVINIGSYTNENKYRDQGLRINVNKITKNKILNKNDLVMVLNDKTSNGNIIGRVILIDEDNKYIYNQRNQRIIPHSKYLSRYLYYLLNIDRNRKKIISLSKGNTQIYVNWNEIKKIAYWICNFQEQKIISNLFEKMDTLIKFISKKIKNLKLNKIYYIKMLFI